MSFEYSKRKRSENVQKSKELTRWCWCQYRGSGAGGDGAVCGGHTGGDGKYGGCLGHMCMKDWSMV